MENSGKKCPTKRVLETLEAITCVEGSFHSKEFCSDIDKPKEFSADLWNQ
jgi:hypothetical protein